MDLQSVTIVMVGTDGDRMTVEVQDPALGSTMRELLASVLGDGVYDQVGSSLRMTTEPAKVDGLGVALSRHYDEGGRQPDDPKANPWRDHDGQAPPVGDDVVVELEFRDGSKDVGSCWHWLWSEDEPSGSDIVRWRPDSSEDSG